MRVVWFSPQNQETLQQGEQPTTKPLEVHANFQEHQKDLADYLKRQQIDKLSAKESKEYQEFLQNLENWDLNGNVEDLRTAGRTEQQNLQDGLKKHALLSSAFLKQVPGQSLRFKVDFKGNETAYWKVGAGDILPPTVNKIRIYKPDGTILEGTRGYHVHTRRIGYFDQNGNYLPVFSNDQIEVVETLSNPGVAARRAMSEHVEIYQKGAARDEASVGSEVLYDAETRMRFDTPEGAQQYQRDKVQSQTREMLQNMRGEVIRPTASGKIEINGKEYPKYSRKEWAELCGNNPESAERWIIRRDPVTGEPINFFGNRIGGGINMAVYPFVKEAEARIKQAVSNGEMIPYQFRNPSSFNWRPIRGGSSLSYHSWGVAIDLNPGTNGMGKQGDMPMKVVEIFESLGFKWGGRWQGARRDPMHFEFRGAPMEVSGLLGATGQKYWKALEPRMQARMPRRRTSAPSSAPARSASSAPARSPRRAKNPNQQPRETAPEGQIANKRTTKTREVAQDHAHNTEFMKLSDNPAYQREIRIFRQKVLPNKARYQRVAERSGIPWKLIAAIHYRESGVDFRTYLHNGEPLGKRTEKVPAGILFNDWESAAVHALGMKGNIRRALGINTNTTDLGPLLAYSEFYNGLGYRLHRNKTSPYVYAGTNIYQGGMYQRDGQFNPRAYDKRPGIAACILALQDA